MERLPVCCGSSPGDNSGHRRAARELGTAICKRNITLVCGDGKSGMMGTLARQVLNRGGRAIDVTPKIVPGRMAGLAQTDDIRHREALGSR